VPRAFPITDVLYNAEVRGLLEATSGWHVDAATLKRTWRERRMSNTITDQSGVWRYREMLPFAEHVHLAVSLREGNTPLLDAPMAASTAAGAAGVQAPGVQSDRLLQGQRHDLRRDAGD